ncbi:hypothetical protein QQ045_012420 [Rhodiola kirilowii]
MSATSVAANLNNILMLNGTNFKDWKENITILFGCMDLDLALREPKMDVIIGTSSESEGFRGIVPDEISSAKDYLAEFEKHFLLKTIRRKQREKWTLNELISFCMKDEEMLKHDKAANSKAPVFNTHVKCQFCEEIGHVKKKCPKWAKYIAWRVKRGLSELPMTY